MLKREPVKRRSDIKNWGQWPADVEPIIRDWNKRKRLSFIGSGVFRCVDCRQLCEPQPYGTAAFRSKRSYDRIKQICDDCLIKRARGL